MPRKTYQWGEWVRDYQRASMRPRPDAAENPSTLRQPRYRRRRFNEAAARCRGKRADEAARGGGGCRFNEAAARCRGKPT